MPATSDMGDLLAGVLAEHGLEFERLQNLIALAGPPDRGRTVALLRQILSQPERQAVSILTGREDNLPLCQTLDEWWQASETDWFGKALEDGRFVTWFQPIVQTRASGGQHRVVGHECLIRLPQARLYTGAEIVRAAHIRNEIRLFDSHARRLAIRCAARQSKNGVYFVNFTPTSIYNPGFCLKTTIEAIQESGLSPANIVFEAVESDKVSDALHLRRICDHLRRNGFGVALDNVGIGANSLQMIGDLQPNFIKLDRSLVQNVERPLYAATIRKLVELADRFGVEVIAVGVEQRQTVENLWLLGVQCMQGYFFGRPGPSLSRPELRPVNLAKTFEISHATHALPSMQVN